MKITPSQEQIEKITSSESVGLKTGETYFFCPFWFRRNSDGSWEKIEKEDIPAEVKSNVMHLRKVSANNLEFFL